MRILWLGLSLVLGAACGHVSAAPYWVAWEGNDYPENEGWERVHYRPDGPAALRTLVDGVMSLDGLSSIEVMDAYRITRPLDPEPGEVFVAEWRVRVNQANGPPNFPYDPGFAIISDDGWHFSMVMGVNEIYSILEREVAEFEAGLFHTWQFRSTDMRTYSLLVDGQLILSGTFVEIAVLQSRIDWGDNVAGTTSVSDWDYFRFGVVPEPASHVVVCSVLFSVLSFIRRRRAQ